MTACAQQDYGADHQWQPHQITGINGGANDIRGERPVIHRYQRVRTTRTQLRGRRKWCGSPGVRNPEYRPRNERIKRRDHCVGTRKQWKAIRTGWRIETREMSMSECPRRICRDGGIALGRSAQYVDDRNEHNRRSNPSDEAPT